MSQHQTTEIQVESLDLLAFFKVLLKGSWLILLCTAIFGGIAFGGSYLVKQTWTAEAEIYKPTTPEMGNYYAYASIYHLISGSNANEGEATEAIIDHAYQELKRQLASYDTMALFWENTEFYKKLVTGDVTNDQALLDKLIGNTRFIAGNDSKNEPSRLLISIENPKQAVELSLLFIEYANLTAGTILYHDFMVRWKTLADQVNAASQIGLINVQNQHVTDAKAWEAKSKMMSAVTPKFDNKLHTFRYLKAPTLLSKTHPDRVLWASIAGILGFLFGCALVLSLNLRKMRNRVKVVTTDDEIAKSAPDKKQSKSNNPR